MSNALSLVVPKYAAPAEWNYEYVDPGLGGFLVPRTGAYVTDQTLLDSLVAYSVAAVHPLVFMDLPPMGFTSDRLANPNAYYPTPALIVAKIDAAQQAAVAAANAGTLPDPADASDGDVVTYDADSGHAVWDAPTGGGESGPIESSDITDATTVGKNVLTAADSAAARSAIGAGTSSLALGTSGTTALAGNTAIPATAADIDAVPETRTVNGKALTGDISVTNTDVGAPGILVESGGSYPARPASTEPVIYMGEDLPDGGGTTSGGGNAVNGTDIWFQVVS